MIQYQRAYLFFTKREINSGRILEFIARIKEGWNKFNGKLANDIPNKNLNAEEHKFFDLPALIKEDGGIKSININYTIYLSSSITAGEMVGVNKSLENVKAQILSLYGTSVTGVKNVNVNMQAIQTPDFQSKNAANPDPVKVTLSR